MVYKEIGSQSMGSARLSQNRGTVVGYCKKANKTLGSKISGNILTSSESTSQARRIILHTVSGCQVYSAKSLNVNQVLICSFTTAECFNTMNI
jgi:hypothetical protein